MAPLLLPAPILALLAALASPPGDGSPHSALIASRAAGYQVVVAHSQPTVPPWPAIRPSPDDVDDDERAAMYAALAGGAWEAQQGAARDASTSAQPGEGEPLMLESELGRIAVVGLGAFILVLVGTEVAPWKVLDKKFVYRLAQLLHLERRRPSLRRMGLGELRAQLALANPASELFGDVSYWDSVSASTGWKDMMASVKANDVYGSGGIQADLLQARDMKADNDHFQL